MLKKVVTYCLAALAVMIFGAYLFAASQLSEAGGAQEMCTGISVTVLDSMTNRFVSKTEVAAIITGSEYNPVGKTREYTDLSEIEDLLEHRSAIRFAEAYIGKNGILNVEITQRRPLLRLQNSSGGFYIDDSGYIFPLVSSFASYVPVVTGHFPIKLQEGFRGNADFKSKKWIGEIMALAEYLDSHPFWNAQIQQIYIEENEDIVLHTVVGDQKILFGKPEDIEYKFAKLKTFYEEIVPVSGWEKYSAVNLKFSDQIVCTKRSKNNKK